MLDALHLLPASSKFPGRTEREPTGLSGAR